MDFTDLRNYSDIIEGSQDYSWLSTGYQQLADFGTDNGLMHTGLMVGNTTDVEIKVELVESAKEFTVPSGMAKTFDNMNYDGVLSVKNNTAVAPSSGSVFVTGWN